MKFATIVGCFGLLAFVSAASIRPLHEQVKPPFPTDGVLFAIRGADHLANRKAVINLGPSFERSSRQTCRSIQITCKGAGSLLWSSEIVDGTYSVRTMAAGLADQEFWGCSWKGRIDWKKPPSASEKAKAETVLASHDPTKLLPHEGCLEALRARCRADRWLSAGEQQEILDLLLVV